MKKVFLTVSLYLLLSMTLVICNDKAFLNDNDLNSENVLSKGLLTDISDTLKLINSTLTNNPEFKNQAWEKTAYISDTFGPRLWGSDALEQAVDGIIEMMKKDDIEIYYKEAVPDTKVWTRGEEYLILHSPRDFPFKIPMTGLGLSLGGDITAEVVMVYNFDELKTKNVKDKIVFYNCKWTSYGQTVQYRVRGAIEAARNGAIGVIIRSIAPTTWETPHTGMMYYEEGIKKIPACAISLEDADMFERMTLRGQKIVVQLYMEAKFQEQTTTSHNIIAEIKGSKYPDEIILMGGHIDSWDVGPQTGAIDDLAGFFMCYEALRLLTKLNLRPKRTIRLIGWSGEEMGASNNGANVYVKNRLDQMNNHVMAFESDLGGNDIHGFGLMGSERTEVIIDKIVRLFADYGMNTMTRDGDNADVSPLYDQGVPIMKNLVQSTPDAYEYFIAHHSSADSMSRLDPFFMDRNVMGIAGMVYSVANLESKLPRNNPKKTSN